MAALCGISDVKRVLHRDQNDTSVDDALAAAVEVASEHVMRYTRTNWASPGVMNTATTYDRPEDSKVSIPVPGAVVNAVRLYRTPYSTPYVAKPLIDYEVQHDGLQAPAGIGASVAAAPGTFAPGTYYWVATATNPAGETNPSLEVRLAMPAGGAATVVWQAYGGETGFNLYRVQASGTETSNPSCLVASIPAGTLPVTPGGSGLPLSVSYVDTGAATTAGTAPTVNQTVSAPARWVRLHPTFFDVPFEGAVSVHYPDNWSRIEIDYTPPPAVPAAVRDGTALTAAALYVRGPVTTSGYTSENLGGYSYSIRPMRGQSVGSNEVIPEVAKALLRPLKRRRALTV